MIQTQRVSQNLYDRVSSYYMNVESWCHKKTWLLILMWQLTSSLWATAAVILTDVLGHVARYERVANFFSSHGWRQVLLVRQYHERRVSQLILLRKRVTSQLIGMLLLSTLDETAKFLSWCVHFYTLVIVIMNCLGLLRMTVALRLYWFVRLLCVVGCRYLRDSDELVSGLVQSLAVVTVNHVHHRLRIREVVTP